MSTNLKCTRTHITNHSCPEAFSERCQDPCQWDLISLIDLQVQLKVAATRRLVRSVDNWSVSSQDPAGDYKGLRIGLKGAKAHIANARENVMALWKGDGGFAVE